MRSSGLSNYVLLELYAQQPADEGHKSLKSAEEYADYYSLLLVHAGHTQALAQRNGKSVHCKSHSYKQQFDKACKVHVYLLPFAKV